MIARVWRGWTDSIAAADRYEEFLRSAFLPSIHAIEGYRGAWVIRRQAGQEVEFMTTTRFDSLEAIRKFAGDDYEAAHVAPQARELLSRFDTRCQHYELIIEDVAGDTSGR